jgi:flagellar hook-length control protein FliK
MSISSPLPVAPPPPANTGPPKGRSGPPDGDPFASVLDRQARTATAEGLPKQQDASDPNAAGGRRDLPGAGAHPAGAETAQPNAEGTDPAALAAALSALLNRTAPAPTQPVATGAPAAAPTGEQPQPQVPAVPAQAPAPAPPASAEGDVPPVASQPAPAPAATATAAQAAAAPAAAPQDATVQQDAAGSVPQTAGLPASGAEPTAAGSAGTGGGGQAAADDRPQAGPPRHTTPAPVADPSAGEAPSAPAPVASSAAAASAKPAAAPAAAQPAAASAPASAPAAPAATPAHQLAETFSPAETAATHTRGVPLDHAVETVRLAMRAGAERGVTHARITLTPVDLGSIEIHLRHTSDGILARVVADNAGATQLLQQSGGDLRRALEQQGLSLLRLDIGASGEQAGQTGTRRDVGAFAGDRGGSRAGLRADEAVIAVETDAPARPGDVLNLSNGALVDVLA